MSLIEIGIKTNKRTLGLLGYCLGVEQIEHKDIDEDFKPVFTIAVFMCNVHIVCTVVLLYT